MSPNDNPWDNPPDPGPTWEQIERDASRGDALRKEREEEDYETRNAD